MHVLFKITAGTHTWKCSLGLQHKSRFRKRKSKLHLDSRLVLLRPGHSKLHLHIIKRSGNLCKKLLLRKPVLNFTAITVCTKTQWHLQAEWLGRIRAHQRVTDLMAETSFSFIPSGAGIQVGQACSMLPNSLVSPGTAFMSIKADLAAE